MTAAAPGEGPGIRLPGFTVERVIAASDGRFVAIARRTGPEGGRRLVSRLPWSPGFRDPELLPERAPWDLRALSLEADGEAWRLLEEALPDGVEPPPVNAGRVPPALAALAARVAAAHAAGSVAGPLHPSLVFVHGDGTLAATAQRVLRARLPPWPEGHPPLFRVRFLVPADVLRVPPSPADDVFRLASMAWAWRHGEAPFGAGAEELSGVLAGRPRRAPADALDRLLASAMDPDPARRPTAASLAEALAADRSPGPGAGGHGDQSPSSSV